MVSVGQEIKDTSFGWLWFRISCSCSQMGAGVGTAWAWGSWGMTASLSLLRASPCNLFMCESLGFLTAWWPQDGQPTYLTAQDLSPSTLVNQAEAASCFMGQYWKSSVLTSLHSVGYEQVTAHQSQGERIQTSPLNGRSAKVTQQHIVWEMLLQLPLEDIIFHTEPTPICRAGKTNWGRR